MILLYIALGGFLGAITRFLLSKRLNKGLPYGTFFINIIGSFLLGYFLNLGLSSHVYAILGVGFCGAFTTFSTFKLEAVQLFKKDKKYISLIYILISYSVGLIFALCGFILANLDK
ncbi:MAG TPA: fluoride efflux transporter CrcB [Pseudoneobacillus sp.]|nr:fluoride efflux transporter CrcB [Pseudoneobacillus sp.]